MFTVLKIANKISFSVPSWPLIARASSNLPHFKAKASVDSKFVTLNLNKNVKNKSETLEQLKYPLIWLRDNCQCSKCYHTSSQSRTINWEAFSFDNAKPKSVSTDEQLKIRWNDNHESIYDFNWLYERNFSCANQTKYLNNVYRQQPRLWSKDTFVLEEFQYDDVLHTDEGLRAWLESLRINGVAMIKNTPLTENECRNIASRVSYLRPTHYGVDFVIRAKDYDATKHVGHSSAPLQMHTDLPFYEHKPGVSLLHCIVQSTSAGAQNLLTDGYHVAKRLKEENPEVFKCLSETPINWSYYGKENGNQFAMISRAPVICLDREGNVESINQSNLKRDSIFLIDAEKVDEWYAALEVFVKLTLEEAVQIKTAPGDLLAISNVRLLHGRTGYVDSTGNKRQIVGGYLDWDEMLSRLRVLSLGSQKD